jgi:hypothetical protein
MKYIDHIKRQIKLLSNKTNLIRFPIEKRVEQIEREKKEKENMVNDAKDGKEWTNKYGVKVLG